MFLAEAQEEAPAFLALLRDLFADDAPAITAVFAIRSDKYERTRKWLTELDGLQQHTFSLPPMPKGSYAEVIKGPARRLDGSARRSKSKTRSSMPYSPTSRRAARRTRCRCWPSRWSGSMASITPAGVSSSYITMRLDG